METENIQNRKPMKTWKGFLMFFLPLLIVASIASLAFLYVGHRNRNLLFQAQTTHHVEMAMQNIELTFHNVITDLQYLADLKELHDQIEQPPSHDIQSVLLNSLLSFAQHKGIYDQIRYIDADGLEQIRINLKDHHPHIVPKEALQNKSERYYFLDTFRLADGEIFVSPLDLNIEQGKIEQPPKPMIRFGTPVFNKDGDKEGIILLNYLSEHLLELFKKASHGFPGEMYLLNRDGYWLSSPHSEDEWGFMYPERHHHMMENLHPRIWSRMSAQERGSVHNDEGTYTFLTAYPLRKGLLSSSGSGEAFQASQQQFGHQDYFWKVVAFMPVQLMDNLSEPEYRWFGAFYLLVVALGGSGSWLLSRSRIREQLGIEALNHKIKELKTTREGLIENEKMASLGRMVAGFAHEINTPIGIAVGAASQASHAAHGMLALLDQEEVHENELQQGLETIDSSSQLTLNNLARAASMIKSFKRTSVDQISEQTRSFAFIEVIQDVINSLRNQFKHTDIQFEITCPHQTRFEGKPGIYTQLLTNLILNSHIHAFDHGTIPGKIRIEVEILNKQVVQLIYSDTGKGMDSVTKAHIFEPFFTTNRSDGSTGLGLYVCYNLVTSQLKGKIQCHSTQGKGTTYTIKHPIQI
jgi:signal transduction histidine kinase